MCAGLRQQVWLLLAVVAIALSLLAMHQLSSNHTVVSIPSSTEDIAQSAAVAGPDAHHRADAATAGHGQQISGTGHDDPSNGGDCPGCVGHEAMALTCLAILILVIAGWVLSRPAAWRGVRLRRRQLSPPAVAPPFWIPRSLSLLELSVSRT